MSIESPGMNRREFLRNTIAAMTASFLTTLPEEAEAFGSLSNEEFNAVVDSMVVPENFDKHQVREVLKRVYEEASGGQKRFLSTGINCFQGTPHLVDFDADTGSFKVECKN